MVVIEEIDEQGATSRTTDHNDSRRSRTQSKPARQVDLATSLPKRAYAAFPGCRVASGLAVTVPIRLGIRAGN